MGKKINIKDLGARENTLCTKEIQKAVDLIDEAGGGTVIIPSGVYLSGTIHLKNTSLYLERGAVLKGSSNINDYYENGFLHNEMKKTISLLYAENQENINIYGEGSIDLSSDAFFDMAKREVPDYGREFSEEQIEECTATYQYRVTQPLFFNKGHHLCLKEIKILNSPSWTVSFNDCTDIRVEALYINNDLRIPNDDGLHFCGCKEVFIHGCNISCGDDCIALTSVLDWEKPCENFVISDCILRSCSKTIVLGYMHGIIRNVTISNCIVKDSNRGFCIMCSSRTGLVEHVLVENMRLETRVRAGNWGGNGEPICIFALYHNNDSYCNPVPDRDLSVNIRDIQLKNISCLAENAVAIVGEAGNVKDISIDGIYYEKRRSKNVYLKGEKKIDVSPSEAQICLPEGEEQYWLLLQECENIKVSNIRIKSFEGKELKSAVIRCKHAELFPN